MGFTHFWEHYHYQELQTTKSAFIFNKKKAVTN